jgi:hypothetical protein
MPYSIAALAGNSRDHDVVGVELRPSTARTARARFRRHAVTNQRKGRTAGERFSGA